MDSGASPRPWRRCGGATPKYIAIVDRDNKYIVFSFADSSDEENGEPINAASNQFANAALIEKCVNCHDDLLGALKAVMYEMSIMDSYYDYDEAVMDRGRAAAAAAERA